MSPVSAPVSVADVESAARVAYNALARVFSSTSRNRLDGEHVWYYLSVDGRIVGRRPTLDELLVLARRGPVAR